MNILAKDYVYIGMVKTGSTYIRRTLRLIDRLEGNFHEQFLPETVYELPQEWRNFPMFGTIRNPLTWYPANWKWFSEDRFKTDRRYIRGMSFEEWVRQDSAIMASEFYYYYTPDMPMVRMENMIEDLTQVMENIRGPLPDQTKEIIRKAPVQNKNPNPSPLPSWTGELRELVMVGARPIFEKYYPEVL